MIPLLPTLTSVAIQCHSNHISCTNVNFTFLKHMTERHNSWVYILSDSWLFCTCIVSCLYNMHRGTMNCVCPRFKHIFITHKKCNMDHTWSHADKTFSVFALLITFCSNITTWAWKHFFGTHLLLCDIYIHKWCENAMWIFMVLILILVRVPFFIHISFYI